MSLVGAGCATTVPQSPPGFESEAGVALLPDLRVDQPMLEASWYLQDVNPESSQFNCAYAEGCIPRGLGNRRLLKFDLGVVNGGAADLVIGDPHDNPDDYEYSACHDHLHMVDFARFSLLGAGGGAIGTFQNFCILDTYDPDPVGGGPAYDCSNQGLSQGWGALYDSSLDCMWIDVTDVAPGSYELFVEVNAEQQFAEDTLLPNTAVITVEIP